MQQQGHQQGHHGIVAALGNGGAAAAAVAAQQPGLGAAEAALAGDGYEFLVASTHDPSAATAQYAGQLPNGYRGIAIKPPSNRSQNVAAFTATSANVFSPYGSRVFNYFCRRASGNNRHYYLAFKKFDIYTHLGVERSVSQFLTWYNTNQRTTMIDIATYLGAHSNNNVPLVLILDCGQIADLHGLIGQLGRELVKFARALGAQRGQEVNFFANHGHVQFPNFMIGYLDQHNRYVLSDIKAPEDAITHYQNNNSSIVNQFIRQYGQQIIAENQQATQLVGQIRATMYDFAAISWRDQQLLPYDQFEQYRDNLAQQKQQLQGCYQRISAINLQGLNPHNVNVQQLIRTRANILAQLLPSLNEIGRYLAIVNRFLATLQNDFELICDVLNVDHRNYQPRAVDALLGQLFASLADDAQRGLIDDYLGNMNSTQHLMLIGFALKQIHGDYRQCPVAQLADVVTAQYYKEACVLAAEESLVQQPVVNVGGP